MNEIKKEVLEIADYLGCNGGELWSEMSKIITKATTAARIEELQKLPKSEIGKLANHSLKVDIHVMDRIKELKDQLGEPHG